MTTVIDESTLHTMKLRNVNKVYAVNGQTLPVLQNINLDIPSGRFVSIVGASGCGKSTLLRLMVGLDNDYTGQITIDDIAVKGPGRERAIVFQDHRLFPWLNVRANIALAISNLAISHEEREARIAEQIGLVGLKGFESAYPHQLSGGMAQRAAIARALVSHPGILLMDEPFGALDAITRNYLQEELLRIWSEQQVTAVIVTHDVEEAIFLSDTVVVMEPRPGKIHCTIDIGLPRPRDRASAEFAALKQQIVRLLRE